MMEGAETGHNRPAATGANGNKVGNYVNDKYRVINIFHSFNIRKGFWKEEKVFINHRGLSQFLKHLTKIDLQFTAHAWVAPV